VSLCHRSAPGADGSGSAGSNRRLQQTQAQVDEVRGHTRHHGQLEIVHFISVSPSSQGWSLCDVNCYTISGQLMPVK